MYEEKKRRLLKVALSLSVEIEMKVKKVSVFFFVSYKRELTFLCCPVKKKNVQKESERE
jgi:hypothetical protein